MSLTEYLKQILINEKNSDNCSLIAKRKQFKNIENDTTSNLSIVQTKIETCLEKLFDLNSMENTIDYSTENNNMKEELNNIISTSNISEKTRMLTLKRKYKEINDDDNEAKNKYYNADGEYENLEEHIDINLEANSSRSEKKNNEDVLLATMIESRKKNGQQNTQVKKRCLKCDFDKSILNNLKLLNPPAYTHIIPSDPVNVINIIKKRITNSNAIVDSSPLYGIPALIEFYLRFDPINEDSINKSDFYYKYVLDAEHCISEFNFLERTHLSYFIKYLHTSVEELLRNTETDPYVNAVFSFILRFSEKELLRYCQFEPKYASFIKAIIEERRGERNNITTPYIFNDSYVNNKLYSNLDNFIGSLRCTKITKLVINRHTGIQEPVLFFGKNFQLLKLLLPSTYDSEYYLPKTVFKFSDTATQPYYPEQFNQFVNQHLYKVSNALITEIWDENLLESLTDNTLFMNNYFADFDFKTSTWVRHCYSKDSIRYITGVACSGKTSILNKLNEKYKWVSYSRGDIGSFAGKSKSPMSIAFLHEAQEYCLKARDKILGDRGPIDNPIWGIIMRLMKTSLDSKELVKAIIKILEENINENTLRSYAEQNCIVMIDPYPSKNKARMLSRGTGGDFHRARINRYSIVQSLVYYTIARIVGWRVILVPYDKHKNLDYNQYDSITESIHKHFENNDGFKSLDILTSNKYDRPISSAKPNTDSNLSYSKYYDLYYAKFIGIYK